MCKGLQLLLPFVGECMIHSVFYQLMVEPSVLSTLMVYVYNPVNLGAKCVNKPFHEKTQILHEDCIIAILDGTK